MSWHLKFEKKGWASMKNSRNISTCQHRPAVVLVGFAFVKPFNLIFLQKVRRAKGKFKLKLDETILVKTVGECRLFKNVIRSHQS